MAGRSGAERLQAEAEVRAMRENDGYLYELVMRDPIRLRARGLDAAHRVSQRLHQLISEALKADPEVIELEDTAYFRETAMPCDGTPRCRAALHAPGCPVK